MSYNIHCINGTQKVAKESSTNLMWVILLASLSIKQDFKLIGKQLKHVQDNGIDSYYLFGFKKNTYKYLQQHKHFIYSQFLAVINSNKSNDDKALSLMQIFCRIDGIGLAKAGFICQLSAGLVGCIDSHNIKHDKYGIKLKDISLDKKVKCSVKRKNKIINYINICHGIGTENLWNTWCQLVFTNSNTKDKTKWLNSFTVSKVHYNYLREVI
tara:strand:- start:1654 stop:2289 length:636 start_codon:yes stop_codon:yes gene_type:complete